MHGGTLGHRNVETTQNDGRRPFEEADSRPGDAHEDEHGRRNSHCESLCAPQGKRFGNQFANGDVEVCDECEPHSDRRHGGYVCVNRCMIRRLRQQVDPAKDNPGGQRLADPADRQRAQRDAKLHGRQEVLKFALQASYGSRAGNLGGEKLLDAGVARTDHRKLGGHKEGVGQNQHGDGDNLEKRQTVHLGCENSIRPASTQFRAHKRGPVESQPYLELTTAAVRIRLQRSSGLKRGSIAL